MIPVALIVVARQLDPLHLLPEQDDVEDGERTEQDDDEDADHYDGDIIVILLFTYFLNMRMTKIVMKMIIGW